MNITWNDKQELCAFSEIPVGHCFQPNLIIKSFYMKTTHKEYNCVCLETGLLKNLPDDFSVIPLNGYFQVE